MPNSPKLTVFLILLIWTLVACSGEEMKVETQTLVSATTLPPTATTVAQIPTATPAATATIAAFPTAFLPPTPAPVMIARLNLETGEVTESLEPLPPGSLDELVWVDGNISGEALILVLELIIGEATPADLGLSEAIGEGGTGVLALAHEYVQSDTADPDLQAEVSRLLNIVAPPLEQIQKYALPTDEARQYRPPGLASMANQGRDCQQSWLLGMPDEGVGNCFLFSQQSLLGHTYQVYYPASWANVTEVEGAKYEAAMDAMLDSVSVYNQWGMISDATIIFSMLPYAGNTGAGFMAVSPKQMTPGEPCPVLIYTDSYDIGTNLDNFKQAVAHELFHCYQVWNYPEIVGRYQANKWWAEGSSEYFSNVVYPATDYEHRVLNRFDINSTTKSILDMSYENAVFFQYLANQMGGPTGVLNLFDTLPISGGKSAQQQALANYGDMQSMLEGLGVAHLSSTGVADPGGSRLVVENPSANPLGNIKFSSEQVEEITSEPFVLTRRILSYAPEKRYDQTVTMAEDGSYTAVLIKERRQLNAWSKLPEVVLGQCEDPTKFVALVVTTDSQKTDLTVEVTEMQLADCDPCLLGTWEIDHDTFAGYLTEAFNQNTGDSGIAFVVDDVTGKLLLTFAEDRQMWMGSDNFTTIISVPAISRSIPVVVEADGTASYTADGKTLMASEFAASVTSDTSSGPTGIDLSGSTAVLSLPLNNLFGHGTALGGGMPQNFTPQPQAYTCTEETLTYAIEAYGTIIWNRSEEIPPTPVPTPTN